LNENFKSQAHGNQYGDMMILPNLPQLPQVNNSINLGQSFEQVQPPRHHPLQGSSGEGRKAAVSQTNGVGRHRQNSINRSHHIEGSVKMSQSNQLQQRSIVAASNGHVGAAEGNPGRQYEKGNTFYDVNGNLQHGNPQTSGAPLDFQSGIQGRGFVGAKTSSGQSGAVTNLSLDRAGNSKQPASRFKGSAGDLSGQEASLYQNHLQLKDNFHSGTNNTGNISPDFNSADLAKNRPPNKISKYASNVELKNMP